MASMITAAVFLMKRAAPYRPYNVADPTPLDVGTIVTSAIRAYGLEPRFTIPLPEPGTLRPLQPLLDSDIFFRLANAPVEPVWQEQLAALQGTPYIAWHSDSQVARSQPAGVVTHV